MFVEAVPVDVAHTNDTVTEQTTLDQRGDDVIGRALVASAIAVQIFDGGVGERRCIRAGVGHDEFSKAVPVQIAALERPTKHRTVAGLGEVSHQRKPGFAALVDVDFPGVGDRLTDLKRVAVSPACKPVGSGGMMQGGHGGAQGFVSGPVDRP